MLARAIGSYDLHALLLVVPIIPRASDVPGELHCYTLWHVTFPSPGKFARLHRIVVGIACFCLVDK